MEIDIPHGFKRTSHVTVIAITLLGSFVLPLQAEQSSIQYTEEQIKNVEDTGWGLIADDGTLAPEWLLGWPVELGLWNDSYARGQREGVPERCARWVGSFSGQFFRKDGRPGPMQRITVFKIYVTGPESCGGTAVLSSSYFPGESWGTSPETKKNGPWWRKRVFQTNNGHIEFERLNLGEGVRVFGQYKGDHIELKAIYTGSYNSMGGGIRTWDAEWIAELYDRPLVPHPDSSARK